MKHGALMTVLSTIVAALAWPATLLAATSFIDSNWSIAIDRSDKAGKLLAEVLLEGLQGNMPVTLVGFSLGKAVFDGGLVAGHEDQEPSRVAHCIKVATQLAYDASTSVETYTYFIQKMSEISIGVSELKETISKTNTMNNEAPPVEEPIVDTSQLLVLNPNISQTKGGRRKLRE